jgi:hypothetical protein
MKPLRSRELTIGLILWCSVSYAIAVSHIQLFDQSYLAASAPAYDDAIRYIRMVEREGIEPAPYRYRVLVPALAAKIPDAVVRKLTSRHAPTASWLAGAKLAILNVLFLSAAGAALFALFLPLGFSRIDALLGATMFYLTRTVVQNGGLPMIDSASWFFLAAAAAAMLAERYVLLGALVLAGVLAKETIFLVVLFALLLPRPNKSKVLAISACIPALFIYVGFRLWYGARAGGAFSPAQHGSWEITALPSALGYSEGGRVRRWTSLSGMIDLASSFGLLWIPALYALKQLPPSHVLRRWAIALPIMLLLIFWSGTNMGRMLFLSFPVVIPLAFIGCQTFIFSQRPQPNPQTFAAKPLGWSPIRQQNPTSEASTTERGTAQ